MGAVTAVGLLVGTCVLTGCGGRSASGVGLTRHLSAPTHPGPPVITTGRGPASCYDCTLNGSTGAFTGAFGSDSATGWEGNGQSIVARPAGTFLVQDGICQDYGFGNYVGVPTTSGDADGLPVPPRSPASSDPGAEMPIT